MNTKQGSLSPQDIKRFQGGELILQGYDNAEIADIVGVTERSVKNWRRTLKANKDNLHALVRKQGSGRLPKLTAKRKSQIKKIVLVGAQASGFADERWTSKRIAAVIRKTFKIDFSASSTRRMVPTLGLSPQMPVVKSHKHSNGEVLRWSRQVWKRIKKKRRNSAFP